MSFERRHGMKSSRRRKSELEWRRTIEAWEESGLSVPEFCRQRELPKSRFYSWRKRLSLAGTGRSGTSLKVRSEGKKPAVKFLPIHIQEVPPATAACKPIEIFLANGCVVRFSGELSDDSLSRIMKLAASGASC
jgi:hypothetical protein